LCDRQGHDIAAGPSAADPSCADPIAALAVALRSGHIAAVKGLGGFHLSCDATNAEAVAELRHRKRRDEKPFAVMVATLADAERLAHLTDDERRLLTAVERPIAIVNRRSDAVLAPNAVCPEDFRRRDEDPVPEDLATAYYLARASAARPSGRALGRLSFLLERDGGVPVAGGRRRCDVRPGSQAA